MLSKATKSTLRRVPATITRNKLNTNKRFFHPSRTMALFPRLDFASDFTPLFRLLDDYDVHRASHSRPGARTIRAFAPRFDVRELKDAYHLDGELPGISQKDVEIEFTDPQTLVIKGQVKREYTSTNADEAADKEAASGTSTPSHQPTVEDAVEGEGQDSTAVTKSADSGTKQVSTKSSSAPSGKYWVSERSIGQFHRTFNFPERVDQDGVRASLKDGILSIVVPKAAAPVMKKIRID